VQHQTTKEKQERKRTTTSKMDIELVNRGVKLIKLKQILKDPEVQATVPGVVKWPTIVMNYIPKTECKLMNYGKVMKNIKGDDWNDHVKKKRRIENEDGTVRMTRFGYEEPKTCQCHTSIHRHKDLGHIQTGDPEVVEDQKLRELFAKGRNFIEEGLVDWDVTEKAILERIKETIGRWANYELMEEKEWNEWESIVEDRIKEEIKGKKEKGLRSEPALLALKETKDKLKKMHEMYVITGTDKVSGNYSLICVQYAKTKMVQELLYNEEKTYEEVREKRKKIIDRITEEMKERFQINIKEDENRIGYNYPTAKNHKKTPKMRIIHNGNKVVTQKLSKELSIFLKAIIASHRKICEDAYRRTAVRHMWMVNDMKPVLDDIKLINQGKTAKDLRTADFPTLYTKIPHQDLLRTIEEGIEEVFQHHAKSKGDVVLKKTYNTTTKKKEAYIRPKPQKGKDYTTKDQLIEMLRHLINNIYCTLGDKTFKQAIGIPMGTDCAPFLANFYLHLKEYNWIKQKTQKGGKEKEMILKHFNHSFRYLDDFLGLNNGNKLEEYREEIYGLRIDVTNEENNKKGDYCNLKLEITNGHISIDLYNKRDTYDFEIIQFPHFTSNTNKSTDMDVIHGQLNTYLTICDNLEKFIRRGRMDLWKMIIINGQSKKGLEQRVWKFLTRNQDTCLQKYNTKPSAISQQLFSKIKEHIRRHQSQPNLRQRP
jgi:hypothetical protein